MSAAYVRKNLELGEYCPWCSNEGWVWLLRTRLWNGKMEPVGVTGCRWCERGQRLCQRNRLSMDYGSHEVHAQSFDVGMLHILTPVERRQYDNMLAHQPHVEQHTQEDLFKSTDLGSL